VHTGGVGFEPEIGSILLPLVLRLLETAEPTGTAGESLEIRVNAAREGLEARIAIEGALKFEQTVVSQLETALEGLGGFVCVQDGGGEETSLRIQFPMARSLRSFLIVEAAGQKIALPWSAVERIHATEDELQWGGGEVTGPVHRLGALFAKGGAIDFGAAPAVDSASGPDDSDGANGQAEKGRPLAILRCGGGSVVVGFDRIVWRENARLTPLPPRLCPVEEVLGGIVSPDSNVILVLNPAALVRRLKSGVDIGGGQG
jgi:chemotaxis protein histidine kinase CheA